MDTIVIAVKRKDRPSEKLFRGLMLGLGVLFLLEGILLSTGFMLPCFLMVLAYFWYSHASRREWEYTLENGRMRIERVSDRGRAVLHDFSLADMEILTLPDDPAVARYKKHGEERLPKFDYTSYREGVPYYTLIVPVDGKKIKLLLDLTPEALAWIHRANRTAVKC